MAFGFYKVLTCNSGLVASDLADFPALVRLTSDSDLAARTESASGFDIAFFSDSELTNQLDHELRSFNKSTGELLAWVKFDPTAASDKAIYIAYGDVTITTDQSTTNVWSGLDPSALGFGGVWHCDETLGAVAVNLEDSGPNNHDAIAEANFTTTNGYVNEANHFGQNSFYTGSGAGQEETRVATPSANWIGGSTKGFSFTCWVKGKTVGGTDYPRNSSVDGIPLAGIGQAHNNRRFALHKDHDGAVTGTAGEVYATIYGTAGNVVETLDTPFNVSEFRGTAAPPMKLTLTLEDTGGGALVMKVYKNKTLVHTSASFMSVADAFNVGMEPWIKSYPTGNLLARNTAFYEYQSGVRVTWSADWISAQYDNQIDPSVGALNFWKSLGAEQTNGPTVVPLTGSGAGSSSGTFSGSVKTPLSASGGGSASGSVATEVRARLTASGGGSASGSAIFTGRASLTASGSGSASGSATLTSSGPTGDDAIKVGMRTTFENTLVTDPITYYPRGNLSAGRSIRAVVDRQNIVINEFSGISLGKEVVLFIANDSVLGVESIAKGEDQVHVSLVEGETKTLCTVTEIIQSDRGVWQIVAKK